MRLYSGIDLHSNMSWVVVLNELVRLFTGASCSTSCGGS
jgi:hypothetical protein